MIVALAELLPGTPLHELLAMDVLTGVRILLAGAALARLRQQTAAGDSGPGHVGGLGDPPTRTIRGGLDVLTGFMKRR